MDLEILTFLTGDAAFFVGDFFTGETLFIGELLLLLAGERDASVLALLIDFGLVGAGSVIIEVIGNTNPRLCCLTGDFCLGSVLEIRDENIGRAPLIFSGEILASAAAAVLPLRLLRSRPRRCSTTVAAFLGLEADFSFLTVDFDLEALFKGDGFVAAFLGETTFLTLFDRDFLSVFLASFLVCGDVFTTDALGVGARATDLATEALATDDLATYALKVDALATEALATEALAT